MEHQRIPTHHLYDVPRSAAQHICRLSDLCYQYGPRDWGYIGCSLMDYAHQRLGLQLHKEDHLSSWEHEMALEQVILENIARQGQHAIYVLQYRGHPEQGWMCLIHDSKTAELQDILQSFCLMVQ